MKKPKCDSLDTIAATYRSVRPMAVTPKLK